MNAKFLEKFTAYRKSNKATETIRIILNEKIKRQLHFIKINPETYLIPKEAMLEKCNLYEARVAHIYWRYWKNNLKNKVEFKGRIQHSNDPVNKLLDVGYHFLYNYLQRRCEALDIPIELGILHKAQNKNSQPLIYDLIEWLRPFIVDHVVYSHFSKKKKYQIELEDKDIPILINNIQKFLNKEYYHSERRTCIKVAYFIDLYLLAFRGSATNNKIIEFNFPVMRHDSRCKKQKTAQNETVAVNI